MVSNTKQYNYITVYGIVIMIYIVNSYPLKATITSIGIYIVVKGFIDAHIANAVCVPH